MLLEKSMRGHIEEQQELISLINVDNLVGREHPIRGIKKMVDEVLSKMSRRFDPSIPPEQLLKAKVRQALYTVPSDRRLRAAPIRVWRDHNARAGC